MKRKFIVSIESDLHSRTLMAYIRQELGLKTMTVKPYREKYKTLKTFKCNGEPACDDYYMDIGNGIIKTDDIPRGTDLVIFAKSNGKLKKKGRGR